MNFFWAIYFVIVFGICIWLAVAITKNLSRLRRLEKLVLQHKELLAKRQKTE